MIFSCGSLKRSRSQATCTAPPGSTRAATESAVTTEGSHPFSTGADTCLVHNGSLSNHNRMRERLRARGESFQTEALCDRMGVREPRYRRLMNRYLEMLEEDGILQLALLITLSGERHDPWIVTGETTWCS